MATYYQYKGAWYLQWRAQGQRVKEWIGKVDQIAERDVKVRLRAKELELLTGQKVLPTGVTFQAFATEYCAWHANQYPASAERTIQIIQEHLLPVLRFYALDHIPPLVIEQYKQERASHAKAATIAKELRTLKAMLNRAIDWGIIDRNPVARVKPPQEYDSKPPHFYAREELVLLFQSGKGDIWRLLANTGMRRAEALNLKRNDVGQESIRVLSTEEARTKSRKWREIPLTDGAREALDRLGQEDFVVPRITPPSLSRAFVTEAGRLSLPGSLHSLRHTYISHLVMAGIPLRTVQVLAGHAHFTTTEKYAHLAPNHLQAAGLAISF